MSPRKRVTKKPKLPRAPLPRQTGGRHEDKTKRLFRKAKYRKPPSAEGD